MTRGQKILAAAIVLIIALYVTGVATQGGSGGDADPRENKLVTMLGGWFGEPDDVDQADLSARCLAERTLTIEGNCVLRVRESGEDLRNVVLTAVDPVRLTTRAPHDDSVLDDDVDAGEQVKVAVDDRGGDISISCAGGKTCVVKVGR